MKSWTEAAEINQRFELLAGESVAISPERNSHEGQEVYYLLLIKITQHRRGIYSSLLYR